MKWTDQDLNNAKARGLIVDDTSKKVILTPLKPLKKDKPKPEKGKPVIKAIKIEKVSLEKNTITAILHDFRRKNMITDFIEELQFSKKRRFRFDWCIVDIKVAIEYEGLFSKKSGHTTATGYTSDCEKYNLAQMEGWLVLRYTAINYKSIEEDLLQVLKTRKS